MERSNPNEGFQSSDSKYQYSNLDIEHTADPGIERLFYRNNRLQVLAMVSSAFAVVVVALVTFKGVINTTQHLQSERLNEVIIDLEDRYHMSIEKAFLAENILEQAVDELNQNKLRISILESQVRSHEIQMYKLINELQSVQLISDPEAVDPEASDSE